MLLHIFMGKKLWTLQRLRRIFFLISSVEIRVFESKGFGWYFVPLIRIRGSYLFCRSGNPKFCVIWTSFFFGLFEVRDKLFFYVISTKIIFLFNNFIALRTIIIVIWIFIRNVWKILIIFRTISLAYSRIKFSDIAKKLLLDSPEDAEFIVAKVNPGSFGQVYPGSILWVNLGSFCEVNPGSILQVNPGTFDQVNLGSFGQVNLGSILQANPGSFDQVNSGSLGQVNPGSILWVNSGTFSQVNPGTFGQVYPESIL